MTAPAAYVDGLSYALGERKALVEESAAAGRLDETVGSYFVYTHSVVRAALDAAGLSPAELAWVVPQNTNETAWDILARLIGVDRGRVWFPSPPDVGHMSWQTGPVAERSGRRRTGPAAGAEQR